jgi:hypothetical protein
MYEPGLVSQVRLMGRQLFEQLRHLASRNRNTGHHDSQQNHDHEGDRKAVRQPPMIQPAHQWSEHKAQQSGEGEWYEQLATHIERGDEQRANDHTGSAIDDG